MSNLYKKISKVMEDVDYLQKDGQISFKSTNYKAITEEKVTTAVRKSLIENGLVILPIEQEHSKDGTLTTVNTKYKIVDIDTGDSEIIVSSGTGADTQDKGVGKAMTYSYKYLLLRTFAIPTGEDPDKVSSAELDEQHKQPSQSNLSEAQVKRLFAIAKSKGIEVADIKKVLMKDFNVTKPEQLTRKEYDELCKRIEAKKGA